MSNTPPLISVIIPVYNRNKQVTRAISDVLLQSCATSNPKDKRELFTLEIIIVDDGSEPPVPKHPDNRVKIMRHQKNRGAGAARNTGVENATGKYIAFLDSDDTWTTRKLAAQAEKLENADPNVFGALCPFEKEAQPGRKYLPRKTKRNWFESFLGGCRVGPGSTLMFRKSLWNQVGPQSETLTRYEDWDWLLRIAQDHEFDCVDTEHAILGHSGRPKYNVVNQSLNDLEKIWQSKISGHQSRRFHAAISVERSAHARINGKWINFLTSMAKAMIQSPGTVAENLLWRFSR